MKVHVAAPAKMSRAMFRVANALEQYAPAGVEITPHEGDADLLVLHVIGLEAIKYRTDKRCAVMQYCVGTSDKRDTGGSYDLWPWMPLWDRAELVWSYYDLEHMIHPDKFFHAPLGIDRAFRIPFVPSTRPYMVLTSGYVNGHGQEAIEEPTLAAQRLNGQAIHLGPMPTGLTHELEMNLATSIGDTALAQLYRTCRWVSGLRYVEGFEIGCAEGLACGARPIMFDRPEMRRWFGDYALFVKESSGPELIDQLLEVMSYTPAPVLLAERQEVLDTFKWERLATQFWSRLMERMTA